MHTLRTSECSSLSALRNRHLRAGISLTSKISTFNISLTLNFGEKLETLGRRKFIRFFIVAVGTTIGITNMPKWTLAALQSNKLFKVGEKDLVVNRPCVLSELLDRISGGWTRWTGVPQIIGDGIWAIPRIGINNGLCNIYINGSLVFGSNVNVDNIQLSAGDNLVIRPV